MVSSLLVRCEKCGYENFPQHRYCGMCGGELRLPQPPSSEEVPPSRPATPPPRTVTPRELLPRETPPQPLNGPSFLGLSGEPSARDRVSYLLEDEEEESHAGRYVAAVLILLVAVLALAVWRWRPDVFSRLLTRRTPVASAESGSATATNPPPVSASPSEVSPAMPAGDQSHVEKPMTGVGDKPLTGEAQNPPAAPAATTPPAAAPAESASSSPGEAPAPTAGNENPATAGAQPEASTPKPAAVEPPRVQKPVVKPAKAPVQAEASATDTSVADNLAAQGEKYLYGNGVAENCARAREYLQSAADHKSTKAQSVLGTMYATGHCTTRDLPLAYHWFAKALHQDPSNTRIEQDLKVLWNQMSAEERQLALRAGP